MTEEARFLQEMTINDGHAGEGLFVTLGIFVVIFGVCLTVLALI